VSKKRALDSFALIQLADNEPKRRLVPELWPRSALGAVSRASSGMGPWQEQPCPESQPVLEFQ
jgi:hypothetical protein